MPEPFRTSEFAAFTLRWAGFQCDSAPFCAVPVHTIGLVGFDFDGMDRWIPVTELIDSRAEDAERVVLQAVHEDETTVPGWQLLAAAFGLPWEVLDLGQIRTCSAVCWSLPPRVGQEMYDQGVEGLLKLRGLAGRSNLSELPYLLADMGRYRHNVGGESKTREEHDGD
jgi:hypothetical protein